MTLEVLNHCCGIISYLPLTSHIPLNLNSLADSLLLAPISRSSKLMFINLSFESLACVKMKDDKGSSSESCWSLKLEARIYHSVASFH